VRLLLAFCLALLMMPFSGSTAHGAEAQTRHQPVKLRVSGLPESADASAPAIAALKILDAFENKYPWIKPESSTGLTLPNNASMDMIPLMQIAGDIAPDVLRNNFRQSDTFIRNKFEYPLDKYLEHSLGIDIPNGDLLSTDDYIAALKKSPKYKEMDLDDRIPRQVWNVMRRECPYGDDCPYCKEWGEKATAHHYHVWSFPESVSVMAMVYHKDMFAEAGLPDRVPDTMEEMYDWAKRMTNPKEDRYGIQLYYTNEPQAMGWSTLSFLYSSGGLLVKQMPDGHWVCSFDDEAAVNAYYFVARLLYEPFTNQYGHFTSVISQARTGATIKAAMNFTYLDERFFSADNPDQVGFGPAPADPTGRRGSELNAGLGAIYAGLDHDPAKRQAAWDYILFIDSPDARRIRADVYVANGAGRYLSSKILKESGHPEYIRQIPKGWEEALHQAMQHGIPEPYGQNCQQVYNYVSEAVDQIRTDPVVKAAIQHDPIDEVGAKNRIREILHARVEHSNEKMLGIIPPNVRVFRNRVALAVVLGIVVAFIVVLTVVLRAFARNQMPAVAVPERNMKFAWSRWPQQLFLRFMGVGGAAKMHVPLEKRGHWQFDRHKMAYLILFPALASIALWAYYPLAQGTVIAFQDYNVRGFSKWTGMDNFADVLFDDDFWYAMWVSVKYAAMYIAFGFFAPIILAFLLTEVPRGKVLFRTIYYLPAVLSGAVVIFLWKGFYGGYGLINQLLNAVVHLLNHIPGMHMADFTQAWLDNPHMALLFCLLPTIWAGVGPGCLIYLAALKTVPDEFYEAAEIDGAGIASKLRHVAIPGIRGLIAINFIGAMIGTIQGGSEMILAMTGGGPYDPYGETEVVGLHIYWQGYGYLRFGPATAMAWILGSLLIGFTVMQLTKLSRMEFRNAGATAEAEAK
jgi:multiple sugar transport system permease protein